MSANPQPAEARFTEEEAAKRIGVSKASLMRERIAGKIHPYRIGQRIIRYTDAIIDEYLQACRNVPEKSASSGSASGQGRSAGAERGSTATLGRRDAHRLAQTIFKRPK